MDSQSGDEEEGMYEEGLHNDDEHRLNTTFDHLRESLLREPINKWAYISLDISLTQPVAPETLKELCIAVWLNDKQILRTVPHQ